MTRKLKRKSLASFQKILRIDQLEKSELFTFLADHIPALVSYIDAQQRYVFINKKYSEWLGIPTEEILNRTVKSVRGNDAYKVLGPHIAKALRGESVNYDHIFKKKDGTTMYVTATYDPHLDKEGNVIGFFSLVSDITERKHAEMLLKETEQKFNRLVDSNVIGVTITGSDGTIYEANDVYLSMVGYTREEFERGEINWRTLTPEEFTKVQAKAEKQLYEKGASIPYEKEYVRKDGSRIPILIGNILLDKKTKKVLAFVLDISKQKQLEQRKDEFIALASHELKTPMTSLKLFSQIMGRELKKENNKNSTQLFNKMEKQLIKLNRLVNSLLDVSRIDAGKLTYVKQTFSLTRLIKETTQEIQTIHDKHKLVFTNTKEITIRADRERIKQVLSNLINNAIKYSPHANKVVITLAKDAEIITVGIQDFGLGIPKSLLNTVFDRYYQISDLSKKSTSGLGLGLYLSKEIIEKHKGELWVESVEGKGSTFYFTLPIVK